MEDLLVRSVFGKVRASDSLIKGIMEKGIQYEGVTPKVVTQEVLITNREDLTRTAEHNVAALVGHAAVLKEASNYVRTCATEPYIQPEDSSAEQETKRAELADWNAKAMTSIVKSTPAQSLSHNKVRGFRTTPAATPVEKSIRDNFIKEARAS